MKKTKKEKLFETAFNLTANANNDVYCEMLNDLIPDLADLIEEALYLATEEFLTDFNNKYGNKALLHN